MKKKVNHIAFVIDKSGSMESIRQETINNINEQLDVIEDSEDNQEDTVMVVLFSGHVHEPRFLDVSERFTEEDYTPRGNTALLDAVGETVTALQDFEVADDEDVSYLVVILSDGQENASKTFNRAKVSSMINELESQGNWTFTFIGADKSCVDNMVRLGVKAGNAVMFSATSEGMIAGSTLMSDGIKSFKTARNTGNRQTGTFYK